MEYKEQTQNIIKRFTVQSFAIKGFSLTFLGLIINILVSTKSIAISIVMAVSVIIFWYLDAYYLKMERVYRRLEENYEPIKGFNYKNYPEINETTIKVAMSRTILPIYMVQLILILTVILVIG